MDVQPLPLKERLSDPGVSELPEPSGFEPSRLDCKTSSLLGWLFDQGFTVDSLQFMYTEQGELSTL